MIKPVVLQIYSLTGTLFHTAISPLLLLILAGIFISVGVRPAWPLEIGIPVPLMRFRSTIGHSRGPRFRQSLPPAKLANVLFRHRLRHRLQGSMISPAIGRARPIPMAHGASAGNQPSVLASVYSRIRKASTAITVCQYWRGS